MRKLKINFSFSLLLAVILVCACQSQPRNVKTVDEWPAIYPDYIDVTIPVDIAPLDFSMADDSVTRMDVLVMGNQGGELHVLGDFADFDVDNWHQLLQQNKGGQLTVTVIAEKDGEWIQYRDFNIHVSTDSLGDWGITYRRIAPGYEMYGHMGIYQRSLTSFDEITLIDNGEKHSMCINCHTANHADPEQYVFHVRGENGATMIRQQNKTVALAAVNQTLGGTMVYPYWHPAGRYCAFSTNKTSQMFHTSGKKLVEVYDASSDVFVYDTQTRQMIGDSLIMKKYWAENCPSFSPDGKWLYFTTAKRQVYPTDFDKERYSLCRVAFDEATGELGEHVDTLISAYQTGKSISWPKPSYDGRYIIYSKADYGYFTIWHPEADIWLMDLETGNSRPLEEVNSQRAESFPVWSSNGKWFLFTSRRDDGLYSRIYLSSMSEDGKATKPFMLPQHDPKRYYQLSLYSFNTPGFTRQPVKTDAKTMEQIIKSTERQATEMVNR